MIKQAVSPEVCRTQIRYNKEDEDKFCGASSKRSRKIQIQYQKSTYELYKEGLKTYNI